jgi:OmpA-OmpF porin, OOP family
VTRRVLALSLLAVAAGCATGGKLRSASEVVSADVEKAKRSGAIKCAPRELALAESNVDFARAEMRQADATRARVHLALAETNVRKALELSKTCGPTQVLIREKKLTDVPLPPPPVVAKLVIEKTDGDKDGVADLDDRCPDVVGKAEFQGCPDTDGDGIPDAEDACPNQHGGKDAQGCPVAKDTDSDGTPDDIDRCPLDAEDKDGFQDEDGCPDSDNDNDGVVDKMDVCPNDGGPIENRGCPVQDKDGDGLNDADDKCPAAAGPKALGGCPDQDGDGVPDPDDKCPLNAGPKDNEGCPDVDRDRDGFADRLDKCPEDPGVLPDGCPKKYTLVEVKKDRIDIKQQVHFATGKATVRPDSRALLDQVVQVLGDFPKMRVSIQGHTDTVGGEAMNMRLSQRRAEAVRDYLVGKGVTTERLEALGFGPTKPIATNKTGKGRSLNRRTEFRIVGME